MARISGGSRSSGSSSGSSRYSGSNRSNSSSSDYMTESSRERRDRNMYRRRSRTLRIRKKPFDQALCFVYYRDDKPHYIYSNVDLRNRKEPKPIWWALIMYLSIALLFMGLAIFMFIDGPTIPRKPMRNPSSNTVEIINDQKVFDEEKEEYLLQKMIEFSEVTGIKTRILTEKTTLLAPISYFEEKAFDEYYNNFNDEKCWLIVYSEKESYSEIFSGFTNDVDIDESFQCYWIGVQGDDTIKIMNVFIDDFNKYVRSQLKQCENSQDAALVFGSAFDLAIEKFNNQEINFNWSDNNKVSLVFACLAIVFIILAFATTFGEIHEYSYRELRFVKKCD